MGDRVRVATQAGVLQRRLIERCPEILKRQRIMQDAEIDLGAGNRGDGRGAGEQGDPGRARHTGGEQLVTFTVQNVNQTLLPCSTDGATYTIAGHLTGIAAELRSGKITLFLHGLGLGEFFWRIQNLPGYDFSANLARLGHASLTIDRLGYGKSGKPGGPDRASAVRPTSPVRSSVT